jgi:hypothetical protein
MNKKINTKADNVKNQIKDLYKGFINQCDLCNHLKNNMVDVNVRAVESHSGFDNEDNISLFYYSDGSMLTVAGSVIRAYIER